MNETARNYIARALGLLWLFDGLLQFQPQMFGPNFVTNILTPILSSQPVFMDRIINGGIWLWSTNMVITDTLAALLQILIGALLLFPLTSKSFKFGMWVSVVWGVVVWLCGEGAGQLLTGTASFYTGAPGAVTIYILLAVLLLIPEKVNVQMYPKLAGWLCVLGALLQLQPSFWSADGVAGNFMVSMMDPLHFVGTVPQYFSNAMSFAPVTSNILLTLILFAVGLALILRPNKTTGIIALGFLFLVWWFGQDFGQLSTLFVGTATDPNTAPLIALLLVPLFIRSELEGVQKSWSASFGAQDAVAPALH